MFRLEVKSDIEGFARRLDAVARNQLPFATALALTMTAKDAQEAIRKRIGRAFVTRSTWVRRGIWVEAARKSFPVARVGSIDWFMEDQETGAARRAFKGTHRAAPLAVRNNPAQRITRAKRPAQLLKKGGRRRFFLNTLRRGPRAGQQAILRRVGKDRFPLQVLYLLEKKTKIKGRFKFRQTVERTVAARLSKNFGAALGRSLATAR